MEENGDAEFDGASDDASSLIQITLKDVPVRECQRALELYASVWVLVIGCTDCGFRCCYSSVVDVDADPTTPFFAQMSGPVRLNDAEMIKTDFRV